MIRTFSLMVTGYERSSRTENWEFCNDQCAEVLFSDFPLDTRGRRDGLETVWPDDLRAMGYTTVKCLGCGAEYDVS